MAAGDFATRAADGRDAGWMAETLASELTRNSYFHGVDRTFTDALARALLSADWEMRISHPADDADEQAGWVVYQETPTLTIAMTYVEPSYRGLGAWKALRDSIGLVPGKLVNVVLAGPAAMGIARKKYVAKHNWGRCLEWLP